MKFKKLVSLGVFFGMCFALTAKPKNVLFIAVDDLKPILNCYGYDYAISPNIDRLAQTGTTFLNAHCQQAVWPISN